jgi:hypothetical protein
MSTQFSCNKEGRREAVLAAKKVNGIDYVEVASADQLTLNVFFLFPVPNQNDPLPPNPSTLTRDNILIGGGVRIRNIEVDSVSAAGNVLTVIVKEAGDFSTYTLRLVTSPTIAAPPPNFDPQLSEVDFSFKLGCPSPFDCEAPAICRQEPLEEPEIDYLAKDYASFRRLMLDRLSVIMPGWRERHAADGQMALVELLAYVADYLSYFQDAVGTEAYLSTARQRISVRRHARLLNYFLHDGCNARAWVQCDVAGGSPADGKTLPAHTPLLTRLESDLATIPSLTAARALAGPPVVFETMHDLALFSANNVISFYTWNDAECCLPRGATRASLRPQSGNPAIVLAAGDLLLFEEIADPESGKQADADPAHRHVVRLSRVTTITDPLDGLPVTEIEWFAADALPFPLCLSARVSGSGGTPEVIQTSIARGNVVLADHGLSVEGEPLLPPVVPERGAYRPELRSPEVTFEVAFSPDDARRSAAASVIHQDPHAALPVVVLQQGVQRWDVRRDLLESDRFATDFVVETERDGLAHLRFGDGILGARPTEGSSFLASYRIGNGVAGNIGSEALRHVVWNTLGITRVRNPLPATGGTEPESLEQARQFAPHAFRIQERAVTERDYAEVAQRHPEVQKAAAHFRWTGSWYTVFVTVDRKGGFDVERDTVFKQDMRNWIDQFRLAGYDVEINGPAFVPLDVVLQVCVKPGYFQADVLQQLLSTFSDSVGAAGLVGFFHPDNFTFGEPVYLSQLYQRAMAVEGVASVEAMRFQRFGRPADQELAKGLIEMTSLEVARLSNAPNFPENGRMQFLLTGGL